MQLRINIPDNLIKAIKLPAGEIHDRLKQELAIRLYRKDMLTFGKARELSGMTVWNFHELLAKEKIRRRYDLEELNEDLETIEDLHCKS